MEAFRQHIAGLQKGRDVSPDHLTEQITLPVPQYGHRRLIHPGPGIGQAVREDAHRVFAILGREQAEVRSIKVHAAEAVVVGIGIFGQIVCHKVDLLPLLVHLHQLLNDDPIRGDSAFTATIGIVVAVESGKSIPL